MTKCKCYKSNICRFQHTLEYVPCGNLAKVDKCAPIPEGFEALIFSLGKIGKVLNSSVLAFL